MNSRCAGVLEHERDGRLSRQRDGARRVVRFHRDPRRDVQAEQRRLVGRIGDEREVVGDGRGRQRCAVGTRDSVLERVGDARRALLPALGQARGELAVLSEVDEGLVGEAVDAVGRHEHREVRVEAARVGADDDRHRAAGGRRGGGLLAGTGGAGHTAHGHEGGDRRRRRHPPARGPTLAKPPVTLHRDGLRPHRCPPPAHGDHPGAAPTVWSARLPPNRGLTQMRAPIVVPADELVLGGFRFIGQFPDANVITAAKDGGRRVVSRRLEGWPGRRCAGTGGCRRRSRRTPPVWESATPRPGRGRWSRRPA